MKIVYAAVFLSMLSLPIKAADQAPKEPTKSAQYWTTSVNSKTGKEGSFHKVWINGDSARVEEYSNPSGVLNTVLLTDGQTGYMYTPRSQNATVFSGIQTLTAQTAAFITEANFKAAWGALVKPQPDASVKGVNCRVYKAGGLLAYFNAATGFGVKYGSSKEAGTDGGTYYSHIVIPADSAKTLYTLPAEAKIKNPGFTPGIGGK